jgi:hypothetical protein
MPFVRNACTNVRKPSRVLFVTAHRVRNYRTDVRFQVLRAACMKIAVFWDVASCSLVEEYRRFRGVYYLHQGDMNSSYCAS